MLKDCVQLTFLSLSLFFFFFDLLYHLIMFFLFFIIKLPYHKDKDLSIGHHYNCHFLF